MGRREEARIRRQESSQFKKGITDLEVGDLIRVQDVRHKCKQWIEQGIITQKLTESDSNKFRT